MKKVLTFLCVCDSAQKASYHHSRGISRNHRRTCTSAPAIISFIEAFPSIPPPSLVACGKRTERQL